MLSIEIGNQVEMGLVRNMQDMIELIDYRRASPFGNGYQRSPSSGGKSMKGNVDLGDSIKEIDDTIDN